MDELRIQTEGTSERDALGEPAPISARARGLDALFTPRGIALIGASENGRKIGGRPLRYMLEANSAVPIYPVNPARKTVQGQPSYARVTDIPGPVDQVILAVPANLAEEAVRDALAGGARTIVMFSSGFAEAGPAGLAAQDRILTMIRDHDVRLLGPNAMGMLNTTDAIYSTFSSAMDRGKPRVGRIGMVSQSGAVGAYLQNLVISRGLALSKFVATGNEADIDAADCIEWMAHDPGTDLLMVYVEGCRNGARLRAALRAARENRKPVILLKAGLTDAGQQVAASHTGALAGSVEVFNAVLRDCGVLRVETLTEMVDAAYACAGGCLPADDTVAVITMSGGVGVMATDAAIKGGLQMPPISHATLQAVREELPLAVGLNPLDTTAQTISDRRIFARSLALMLRDRAFGSVMMFLGNAGRNSLDVEILEETIRNLRPEFPRLQFALCTQSLPELAARIEAAGCLVFEDPDCCVRALAAAVKLGAIMRTPLDKPAPNPLIRVALPTILDEAGAKNLLSAAGVPFVPEIVAETAEAALAAARGMGFPVVLKVVSPEIAHKSEAGAVALNIRDADDLQRQYRRVLDNAGRYDPQARIRGVSVAKMVSGGVETIIGGHRDPTFGPMVMFGLGGIYTEVLRDTVLRPAPVDEATAIAMIREIRAFAVLDGARGQPKADLSAIAGAIVAVSQFLATQGLEVESVEINPFLALPEGGVGVDALIHRTV